MDEKEIQFEILPDGTINIDMKCFKGGDCEILLKKIAKEIGVLVSSQKKQEYYEDSAKTRLVEEE